MQRARADRNYDDDTSEQINTHPDETTIWAIQALYQPNEANDHVLGLPSAHLLQHMYDHPLTVLPTVPTPSSAYRFLTTLKLGASDGEINDQNVVNLKWCTHLTALWTTNCSISDYGIALLASALELPGKKGMYKLRAWSVARCKAITDKSMRSFARFPGLVMLGMSACPVSAPQGLVALTFRRPARNLLYGCGDEHLQPAISFYLRSSRLPAVHRRPDGSVRHLQAAFRDSYLPLFDISSHTRLHSSSCRSYNTTDLATSYTIPGSRCSQERIVAALCG